MARLIAQSACAGLLPLSIGGVSLSEVALGPVTLVAPYRGRQDAVFAALDGALGCGFPPPNRVLTGRGARAIWTGIGRALVVGAAVPDLAGLAAVVDQTDAAATVRIEGPAALAVLARLVPVDLRPAAFGDGATARTMVNHMTAQVTRVGEDAYEVMVFRSMAGTLVAELTEAARHVAARGEDARLP